MFYLYDTNSIVHKHEDEYYNESDLRDIVLKAFVSEEELNDFWQDDNETEHRWWCVYDIDKFSWIPAPCRDEQDAIDKVLLSLNHTTYEFINDL